MRKNKIISIGPVIKRLRMAGQLSQEELAHRCHLDTSFISNIERDKQLPGLDTFIALAEVFDMKASALLKVIEDYNEKL